jgi:putative flippase GtrA
MPIQITSDLIFKLIKFLVVGFIGLGVDFGITFLLKERVKVQKYLSNSIGFIIAASSNYILNRTWTFHSKNPDILLEYSHFLFIAIIGLGINSLVLWLLVSRFKYNFYFSKLIATIVTTFWNFIANLLFTFT